MLDWVISNACWRKFVVTVRRCSYLHVTYRSFEAPIDRNCSIVLTFEALFSLKLLNKKTKSILHDLSCWLFRHSVESISFVRTAQKFKKIYKQILDPITDFNYLYLKVISCILFRSKRVNLHISIETIKLVTVAGSNNGFSPYLGENSKILKVLEGNCQISLIWTGHCTINEIKWSCKIFQSTVIKIVQLFFPQLHHMWFCFLRLLKRLTKTKLMKSSCSLSWWHHVLKIRLEP